MLCKVQIVFNSRTEGTIISFTHFLVYQETSVIPGRAVSRQAANRDYFADFIIHLSVFGQSG